MAAMTSASIRTYVYDYLDVEVDELPTSVLDVFMTEAYNKIVAISNNDPTWLHVEYALPVVSGTQSYDLDTTVGMISPTPLQSIADVRGTNWSLRGVQHRQVREDYRIASASTGTPLSFSLWGRNLFLWPTPGVSASYTVLGTRQPKAWVETNLAPDCPEEFHRLIADYTLGRSYVQQDDAEGGMLFLTGFDQAVQQIAARWVDGTKAGSFVVNGNGLDTWRGGGLGPLIMRV